MNSFICWIGGKKLLRKTILENYPVTKIDRYIEVFGGAGWVLFAQDKHADLEVFNDVNSDLINLYRCIKYHLDELKKELDWLLVSREQFISAKEHLSTSGLTDIQRAAKYFLLIKTSFGGDRRSFATNKKNLTGTIERLDEIKDRLKSVVIENKDFENLIKVYDRPGALFYLDPPYHLTEKFYDNVFAEVDHIRLRDALRNIKGKFILSYNNDEFVRDLYSEFNQIEVSRNNNMSNKEKSVFNELIIRNF